MRYGKLRLTHPTEYAISENMIRPSFSFVLVLLLLLLLDCRLIEHEQDDASQSIGPEMKGLRKHIYEIEYLGSLSR